LKCTKNGEPTRDAKENWGIDFRPPGYLKLNLLIKVDDWHIAKLLTSCPI
jgi:hypothetical protein